MDKEIFIKKGVQYYQMPNGTIYCAPQDQSGKVGGQAVDERNEDQINDVRIERIRQMKAEVVLDYGCGHGFFLKKLYTSGLFLECHGYDKFSSEHDFTDKPTVNHYDAVTMVEVVEHLSAPYREFDEVFDALKEGGTVIIETSFVDWMTSEDPYIDPELGHTTIFSHVGLDEVMIIKGFVVGTHINDNVRIYHKPVVQNKPKISLITMGQGNVVALKRTLENTKGIVDEVIFGDMLIFEEDREVLKSYRDEFNLKIVRLPFNYIFKNGFAETLNTIAGHASNDMVLYLNVSEIIEEGKNYILPRIDPQFNCYFFTHSVETHHWIRFYNRQELKWSGPIHEEIIGDKRLFPSSIFVMADSEKDMDNEFKARVFNDVKEINYFSQYMRMVDDKKSIGATNMGWVKYAHQEYDSMKARLLKKGKRYEAFISGDFKLFLQDIYHNVEFQNEEHTSTDIINYQGKRKAIL